MASHGRHHGSGSESERRRRAKPRHRPFVPKRNADLPNLEVILECFQDKYPFNESDIAKIRQCLAEIGMDENQMDGREKGEAVEMRAARQGERHFEYDDVMGFGFLDDEEEEGETDPRPKQTFWRRLTSCSCMGTQRVDP